MDFRSAVCLVLLAAVATSAVPTSKSHYASDVASMRVRRQASPSTTTAPPRRRPSNIFSLFSTLLAETRDDTRRAFAEIGNLFSSQFSPNTPRPGPVSGPLSSSTTTASSAEDGEDVTTTTEPYRITREEFNGILRNNLRGIVRLFGREVSNAISDSGRNVREFGREFRSQLRPLVEVRNRQQS